MCYVLVDSFIGFTPNSFGVIQLSTQKQIITLSSESGPLEPPLDIDVITLTETWLKYWQRSKLDGDWN